MAPILNPDKALIFRITHRDNLPFILENGLWAPNSGHLDPNHRNIGNVDLIGKRARRVVHLGPRRDSERLRALLFHAIFDHAAQYPYRIQREASYRTRKS